MKKSLLVLLFGIFLIAEVGAQSFRVTSGSMSASNIDSCSTTTVTVNSFLGCINWSVGGSSFSVNGTAIEVRVNCTSSFVCAGAISNPVYTQTLQNLSPGVYTVNGAAYLDNVLTNTQSIGSLTVTACMATGIDEFKTSNSLVFSPNPSNGNISVYNPSSKQEAFQLFDLSGRLVKSGVLSASQQSKLDFTELNKGIYFIRYSQKSQEKVQKLVIR